MIIKTKRIKPGKWRTVETAWNAKLAIVFKAPAGAKVKVRYGLGWFGKDRQKNELDGVSYKTLNVGRASIAYARFQIKVDRPVDVTYAAIAGGIANRTGNIPF